MPKRRRVDEGRHPVRGGHSGPARPQGSPWFLASPDSPGFPASHPGCSPWGGQSKTLVLGLEDTVNRAAEGEQARREGSGSPSPALSDKFLPSCVPKPVQSLCPALWPQSLPHPWELRVVTPESSHAGAQLPTIPASREASEFCPGTSGEASGLSSVGTYHHPPFTAWDVGPGDFPTVTRQGIHLSPPDVL